MNQAGDKQGTRAGPQRGCAAVSEREEENGEKRDRGREGGGSWSVNRLCLIVKHTVIGPINTLYKYR